MTQKLRAGSAKDLLNRYDQGSLLQMARQKGLPHQGQSKATLVTALAKTLFNPETIRSALDDLEPVERELLDNLIVAGGEAPTVLLRQQLEADGKVEPAPRNAYGGVTGPAANGSPIRRGSRNFADLVARLGALGLVHTANVGPYSTKVELGTPGLYLFVPSAVMKQLPAVSLPAETAPPPREEQEADPSLFLRDVYLVAGFARQGPIPLTVRGLIPKRTLVQIDEALRVPEGASRVAAEAELGRLPLLRALEEDIGLLVAGPEGLSLGKEAQGYFRKPPGEQCRTLFDAYRATQRWSELSRLPNILMTPRDNLANAPVAAARRRVLDEVAGLPAGQWIPISHLVDRIRRRAFDFLLSRTPRQNTYYYSSSYLVERNPYYGDNAMGLSFSARDNSTAVGWETVEGQFIRVIVTEALHWLGLVDLGAVEGEEPGVFRVTADGALLLQGGTPASAERQPRVVIQPNFQIFAFEPTGEDVLFVLDSIAERVRAEQAMEYRLTRESVYAAQRQGMEAAEIRAFLERISSTPLPQNVRRSLEEWGAQHERIVVRRHTPLLHAADEQTLDTLYAAPELRGMLGRRLSPTVALIPSAQLSAVYTYLATRGPLQGLPLPALSEGNDAGRRGVVTVDGEGRITFGQRLPSIHVQRALHPFTEDVGDGTLRLTPERLRQAASKNNARSRGAASSSPLAAAEMIATLERLQGGPLPDEVTALVRRWAKDWGKGALVDAAVLQVEAPGILADLVADEEFGRYLQPVPGAPTLALVSRQHVEQVRQRLQERGMHLESRLLAP